MLNSAWLFTLSLLTIFAAGATAQDRTTGIIPLTAAYELRELHRYGLGKTTEVVTTGLFFRDEAGRTRMELDALAFIRDPIAGRLTVLDSARRTARVSGLPAHRRSLPALLWASFPGRRPELRWGIVKSKGCPVEGRECLGW
jgi:hypothetical protein